MYLQTLEINGFKSFARKTRLVFEPGITAIVGPNGCGKSNVSDAIRWVLGEQRASALRGSAMTDVIFNGTDVHKPLGMAEVSITFSDCEKQLGTEFNEVTITRRVFRTGEGQYFINKNPCRLKDIQRLFMDTGIGTTSYSVMAQGQIDAILSSRPEDRRAIFEEASGITRFRADRKEALRKLEATDQNLLRLDDVIEELRKQIASLQRQATRARRFKALQEELRKLDLFLTARRIEAINTDGRVAAEQFAKAQAEATALRDKVADAENAMAAIRQELIESEQGISDAVEAASSAHHDRAQADEKLRLNASRLRENRDWKARDEREIASTRAVREEQEARRRETETLSVELAAQLSRAADKLAEVRQAFDTLHGDSDEARAALQRLRDESVELERTNARLQNELTQAEASARESILRNERLTAEKARLTESVRELVARLDDAEGEAETLQSMAEQNEEAVAAAEVKLRSAREASAEAQKEAGELRSQLAACEARLKLLEEAARSPDGIPEGARKLLDETNPLALAEGAVIGPIADQFSAPKEVRTALQAVLRAWLDAVAIRSGSDMPSVLGALLSAPGANPARIIAADCAGTPAPTALPAPDGAQSLLAQVKYSDSFASAAQRLLANVFIVDTIPEAIPEGMILVTPAGVVARAGGMVDVWSAEGVASNPFSRHALLEDTRTEKTGISGALAEAEDAELRAADDISATEESLNSLRNRLDQSRRAAAQKEGEVQSIRRELAQSKTALAATTTELDRLAESTKAATEHTQSLAARIHDMSSSRTRLADAVAQQSDEVRRAETEFLNAQGRLTDARLAHAQIQQKAEYARSQGLAIANRINELDAMIATRSESIASYEAAIAKLVEEDMYIEDEIPELDEKARAADALVSTLRAERASRQAEVDTAEKALQDKRRELEGAEGRKTKAEVALAEMRMRLQGIVERLQNDWHLTPEDLAAEPAPDWGEEGEPPLEECAAKVQDLRRKMDDMGPVNLVAIEDCQKSEERLVFLTGQEKDLKEAKEKLMALIKDLDTQSVARFRDTFTKVNENFRNMYQRLFGGGTAELRLLDDENVLECGIDIVARPPGKKPQTISLLSGGERTMTAVALLFSIYAIKPSPFAILDELDAALDDSNIGRFVDVLKDFLELSQFLIITHNQHTIAGADIVYGVTQQEKGVSTIISMRLKRVGIEAPKGEELPAPDAPPPPGARKLRNAETYVKKPKSAKKAQPAVEQESEAEIPTSEQTQS